jgi:uncharacterized protein with von Willebrand factor type A (vWA) domain
MMKHTKTTSQERIQTALDQNASDLSLQNLTKRELQELSTLCSNLPSEEKIKKAAEHLGNFWFDLLSIEETQKAITLYRDGNSMTGVSPSSCFERHPFHDVF